MTTKKILITGANSYIGMSFEKWLSQWPDEYSVETVDMLDGSWRDQSFAGYDVVFHVAGIAHVSADPSKEDLYYKINRDLAIETAEKAKADGVKQFIFMSSAIVYGDPAPIGICKIITRNTPVSPTNFYGDSKVQAEIGLQNLVSKNFKIVILRPPMIYGKGSKGNYPVLTKIAQCVPVFPQVDNERSMLYVSNLAEFTRLMIVNEEEGIFWPQNAEYSNTSELVKMIATVHGKKVALVPGFQWSLKFISRITRLVNKAFGNLVYEHSISKYKDEYRLYSLSDSIRETENDW